MSKKDKTVYIEGEPAMTTVSPYENVRLSYETKNESDWSESQQRLECLKASVTFYASSTMANADNVLRTAKQFWEFVKSSE